LSLGTFAPTTLLIFLLAVATSVAMMPVARRLGQRWGLVDRPGGRRQHQGVISRLGGITLYAGFMVAEIATEI
jgi:UDP-GlcNAc:undecaprenyl-phosphate GlcNAc-1-phosphate transferase